MNTIQTLFLGIIQGLTEFLPISSSGHLVLCQHLMGFREPELLLDTSLHLGTLAAVCTYFRSDLKGLYGEIRGFSRRKDPDRGRSPDGPLIQWIVLGTVPTALIGGLFADPLASLFGSVTVVGAMLLATGFIVGGTRLRSRSSAARPLGVWIALAVGTAQGLAIIPGISRSGATIACGMICGLDRELAARYSFLLSIPAIVGAVAMEWNPDSLHSVGMAPLIVGFLTAAVVGWLSLKFLMAVVKRGHLYYFAPYCWTLGLFILLGIG